MTKRVLFLMSLVILIAVTSCEESEPLTKTDQIRLNQVGYYPAQEKIAVADQAVKGKFIIRNVVTGAEVFEGKASEVRRSAVSGKERTLIDFTKLTSPGKYVIELDEVGISYPFEIKEAALQPLAQAAARAFYYQRSGMPIEEEYAGKWSRPMAHPDDYVKVHANASKPGRPADKIISSSKGWYDAGDYNKYIVNSGFTVGMMLALYEDAPHYFEKLSLNIPESHKETPDLLEEIRYNLDWMLTMQDPSDGGVYHKLTTPGFEGFIKPSECNEPRYVVYKSVTAALDFAASMAQAARVYAMYEHHYPGFSDQMLQASRRAFNWALERPEEYYIQDNINENYGPEITTGSYGDGNPKDEFFWAATELYCTTGEPAYLDYIIQYRPDRYTKPGWGNVSALGFFTLLRNADMIADLDINNEIDLQWFKSQLLEYCDNAIHSVDNTPFVAPYGNIADDFYWGCLAEGCCNQAISLLTAHRLTGETKYLQNALRNADYILGRNATGYCYVTGFGVKSPLNLHHRISATDDIDEPLPGFLVGGPNPGQQDKGDNCVYTSDVPDESYLDSVNSYASNEVAINWNASLLYLSAMIDRFMNL